MSSNAPKFSNEGDKPREVWVWGAGGEAHPILKRIWVGLILTPLVILLALLLWGTLDRKQVEPEHRPEPKSPVADHKPITLPPGLVGDGKKPDGPIGPAP